MTKYIIAALLALSGLLGAGLYVEYRAARVHQARADSLKSTVQLYATVIEDQTKAHQRSTNALSARLRTAEADAVTRTKELHELNRTLEAARPWADSPLPDGVADWLRGNASGTQGAKGPASR